MTSVIIPAAGLASRMKPLSRGVSKAMIPVNGRPLISYILDHLFSSDPNREIVIVENELGDIKEFVKRVYANRRIKTVVQEQKLGPLHAIHIGWAALTDKKPGITVWLGDTICLDEFDYERDFLAVHPVPDPHRWCLVDENGKLYDKPDGEVPTDKALVGVYNFTNRAHFDKSIEKGMKKPVHKGEHQIAALLESYVEKVPMKLVVSEEWYDCGELTTYYESKAKLLRRTARSFNKLYVDTFRGTITKSSDDSEKQEKIECEKNWFNNLTPDQSLFCPRILPSEYGNLVMSLEPGTALNEVLVYDNLRNDSWQNIIRKILNIHHQVFYSPSTDKKLDDIRRICFEAYYIKNTHRLDEIAQTFGGRLRLDKFVEDTSLELCKYPTWSECMHGDSHLGNIIYDAMTGSIKFVDPRGVFGPIKGNGGDIRYDMAKLLQDFYCGYAMIMADRYAIHEGVVTIDWVGDTEKLSEFLCQELEDRGYDVKLLKKLAVILLLTAIPFHADSPQRQRAFYHRALNLMDTLD
jgi:dTDP-glucose pyrophosphorylase